MIKEDSSKPLLRRVVYFFLAIVLGAGAFYGIVSREKNIMHARLGGEELLLRVADTEALRERGLSGTNPLGEHEGMIFVFSRVGNYGIWMKEMLYPIDIIWFDEKYRIIGVEERATPDSFPKVFNPVLPTKYVVELRAGFISDHHLENGDTLEIKK